MSATDVFFLIPGPPALSVILTVLILLALLYMGRSPFRQATLALGRVLHKVFRLAAWSVSLAEQRLVNRNREVLLASGRESAERIVEREFQRIEHAVDKDLRAYPELHRELSEQIRRIDEDFRENTESPPDPPDWVDAVEAVAKLKKTAAPGVANVLEDIHKSLERAQREAMREYRKAAGQRHKLLATMSPTWRRIESTITKVKRNLEDLLDRSKRIDRHMDEFEQINKQTDRALQTLSSSSVTQFFIAGLVILIAIGGALVNFYLIARPMQEMVGGATMLGPFRMANVAAMVIIFVELSMGLFLMESLRITRLFPVISALDDRKRMWMAIITFVFLTVLAVLESMLGLMREILAAQDAELLRSLSGGEGGESTAIGTSGGEGPRIIPLTVHMVLSFLLPYALAFVAIPLESLVHSGRTVLGMLLVGFLRAVRLVLRALGTASMALMRMVNHIYDLIIFLPLWIEARIRERMGSPSPGSTSSGTGSQ